MPPGELTIKTPPQPKESSQPTVRAISRRNNAAPFCSDNLTQLFDLSELRPYIHDCSDEDLYGETRRRNELQRRCDGGGSRWLSAQQRPRRRVERMARNDVVLLDSLMKRLSPRFGTSLPDSERFELFAFDQLLKPYDPTYEDLSAGWVDGGNDGGIEASSCTLMGGPTSGMQAMWRRVFHQVSTCLW